MGHSISYIRLPLFLAHIAYKPNLARISTHMQMGLIRSVASATGRDANVACGRREMTGHSRFGRASDTPFETSWPPSLMTTKTNKGRRSACQWVFTWLACESSMMYILRRVCIRTRTTPSFLMLGIRCPKRRAESHLWIQSVHPYVDNARSPSVPRSERTESQSHLQVSLSP